MVIEFRVHILNSSVRDKRKKWMSIYCAPTMHQERFGLGAGLSIVMDVTMRLTGLVSQLQSGGADCQNPGRCLQDSVWDSFSQTSPGRAAKPSLGRAIPP